MRSLIVYESMYGNTRQVAEAIADGCRRAGDATAVRAADFMPSRLAGVDLLVLGGPTHAWSMSRPGTRQAAISKPGQGTPPVEAEPGAPGIRELLEQLPRPACPVAVFDTRIGAPALVTGRASAAIGRRLRRHGVRPLGKPHSFLVSRTSRLRPGELDRARLWGIELTEQQARLAGSKSQ
ncbi:MAG TPA: flavodoxin domain-containing protein [Jatrophihabitans sp.]|nr:flavodoxin domain-containing protein [Jatrophihabitans sp.]